MNDIKNFSNNGDEDKTIGNINHDADGISISEDITARELIEELSKMSATDRGKALEKLLQTDGGQNAEEAARVANIAKEIAHSFSSIDATVFGSVPQSEYSKASEDVEGTLMDIAADTYTEHPSSFASIIFDRIGDVFKRFAVVDTVLLLFVKSAKEYLNIEGDIHDKSTETYFKENGLIDALTSLAGVYITTNNSKINLIIEDSQVKVSDDIRDEITQVCEEYLSYHEGQGEKDYRATAQEFSDYYLKTEDKSNGDIIVSDRISAISLKDFQFALTTRPNPTAFIAPLGTGAFTRFRYDETLQAVINVKTKRPIQEMQTPAQIAEHMKDTADNVSTPDFALLPILYSTLLKNAQRFDGDNLTVPMQALSKAAGINLLAGHAKDIEKKFAAYEPYVGWINRQGLFAVLKFIKRDDNKGTITFSAPYLHRLLYLVMQEGTRHYKSGRKALLAHNSLVHTTIFSERNQTAAAIVFAITNLLLQNKQHLNKKDGEKFIVCHISFSTLADYAELSSRIDRTKEIRERTRMLKSCFTKAFELLRTKSDAYKYYTDLEIYTIGKDGEKTFATVCSNGKLTDNLTGGSAKYNAIAPTFAAYNSVLYFRHKGANKNWKHDV